MKPENEATFEQAVRTMLECIGEDPDREGLLETPERVMRAWRDKFAIGYEQDPANILGKVFVDGSCDQMVLQKNIEMYSCCEHHMVPFVGVAHVAYIPDGKVVGLSKLVRLVECYSRRLQIQERLTQQIANALQDQLNPKGVGVVIDASHMCMSSRGVEKQHSSTVTSAMLGSFQTEDNTRREFLALIGLDGGK